jgi:hypothetical protein
MNGKRDVVLVRLVDKFTNSNTFSPLSDPLNPCVLWNLCTLVPRRGRGAGRTTEGAFFPRTRPLSLATSSVRAASFSTGEWGGCSCMTLGLGPVVPDRIPSGPRSRPVIQTSRNSKFRKLLLPLKKLAFQAARPFHRSLLLPKSSPDSSSRGSWPSVG